MKFSAWLGNDPAATVITQEERELWHAEWQHEMAAVSEGLCPVHKIPLDPVPAPARRIAGHCRPCGRYWGANLGTGNVGWWLDHDPVILAPAVAVPEWMGWREP